MTSTISPGTSISHSTRPPYFPGSSSVTFKASQGCILDTFPVSAQTAFVAKYVKALRLQFLVQSMPMFSFGRGSVSGHVVEIK